MTAKRKPNNVELNMTKLQENIRFRGMVRLDQLREVDESVLSLATWPVKDGTEYYACATTGLLFDKQTGRCLQSSLVSLDLTTVEPSQISARQYQAWLHKRKGDPHYGHRQSGADDE
jgi:hypothetical protein